MGVDREPGNAEGDAQHDVGGLPPHPRQGDEVLHPGRYLAVEPLDQGGAGGDDGFRLGAEEPGGLDQGFDRPRIGVGQRRGVRIPGEQDRRDGIHRPVGGLRREDGRHQHLERGLVVELRDCRIDGLEPFDREQGAFFGPHSDKPNAVTVR